MLFIAACHSQGLAARFVSGYSMHHPPEVSEHELHAWAEVYLPGGGWRGYDPSLGLAVADGHVVLAAAPDHHLAAPVSGHYRGTGVGSELSYRIRLKAASSPAGAGRRSSADGAQLKPAARGGQFLEDHRCLSAQGKPARVAFRLITMVEERTDRLDGNDGLVLVEGADPVAAGRLRHHSSGQSAAASPRPGSRRRRYLPGGRGGKPGADTTLDINAKTERSRGELAPPRPQGRTPRRARGRSALTCAPWRRPCSACPARGPAVHRAEEGHPSPGWRKRKEVRKAGNRNDPRSHGAEC